MSRLTRRDNSGFRVGFDGTVLCEAGCAVNLHNGNDCEKCKVAAQLEKLGLYEDIGEPYELRKMTFNFENAFTAIEYAIRNHESGEYPDALIIQQYKVACRSLLKAVERTERGAGE